jgi:pyruvate,water dikinase
MSLLTWCSTSHPKAGEFKSECQRENSPFLRWLRGRAIEFRLRREKVSSVYTFGYGLFRPLFLEIGSRLERKGMVGTKEDVFYLTWEEIHQTLREGIDMKGLVVERREDIESVRDIEVPGIIFGDVPPPVWKEKGGDLKGTPTSGGYYEGPVRVVRSLKDFDKSREGDVMVVPFSDVAWIPFFSRAGAILAESGGFLSHSSIVAREYGIPAVVSVQGVLDLEDGTLVKVDGYNGLVLVNR